MSKLSFRARALDPSKPMPIYLAEELPDLPEYSAINRAVPQMPSGMEKEEESEHHLQRAICTGLIIPTPEVFTTDLESYDRNYPPSYKMPRQMIHMQPLGLEQDIPDYDMDSADEVWVNSQIRRLDLTPLKFEQMMDRLEKSSGQTVVTLNEAKALLKQDDEVSIAVYDYWLNKRLKTQHPLILSVKTENRSGAAANNPYLAFRRRTEKMQTRKNRKNDETSYEKMLKLRRDLSRAVTLLDMVKRREKTKREQLHLSIEIFEKRYQVRDFSGSLVSEINSNIKTSRPAFAPIYSNQYSHHHQSQSGMMSSSASPHHHFSTSQYLNSTGLVNPSTAVGTVKRELDSGSRKEKRQYKKRKHKMQRDRTFTIPNVSPAAVESTISSEDDDLAGSHIVGSEGEDEGLYTFRRNKNCEYHKPLTQNLGNWPWESKEESGLADRKFRFTLTSIRQPRPRCIGFARRRLGRGGRVILDRISTDMDDFWSTLNYTIFDNSKTSSSKANMDDNFISRDPLYTSSSVDLLMDQNKTVKDSVIGNCDDGNDGEDAIVGEAAVVTPIIKTESIVNSVTNLNSSIIDENSISRISGNSINKEIKLEQFDFTEEDSSGGSHQAYQHLHHNSQLRDQYSMNLHHQQQEQQQQQMSADPSRNNRINNNNNNFTNLISDTTVPATLDNNIKTENVVIKRSHPDAIEIKEEIDKDLLNILDDENMNLACLSTFINASRSGNLSLIGGDRSRSDLIRAESCDAVGGGGGFHLTGGPGELHATENLYQKLFRSTSLPLSFGGVIIKQEPSDDVSCKEAVLKDILSEIRKNWLHFRPKTPPGSDNSAEKIASNGKNQMESQSDVAGVVDFSEQTPISVEMQQIGSLTDTSSPPTSVFKQGAQDDIMFVSNPFTFQDLLPDDQLLNYSPSDNSSNGVDLNFSGESLNELNLSLGEEDNENMLDNILQECQIDDIKALNHTTNFWNGILDDGGGFLDVMEDKKPVLLEAKESGVADLGPEFPGEEKENKKQIRRKTLTRTRSESCSRFSLSDASREEKFFRKDEVRIALNSVVKIEPPEEILAPSSSKPVVAELPTFRPMRSGIGNSGSIGIVSNQTGNSGSGQDMILHNLNVDGTIMIPQRTRILKQEAMATLTNNNNKYNQSTQHHQQHGTVMNVANIKLENEFSSDSSNGTTTTIINHGLMGSLSEGSCIINDIDGLSSLHQSSSLSSGIDGKPQHILLQQIPQSQQTTGTQILNVANSNLAINDSAGTILLAGSPTNKRQINGPAERNAIQNILRQTKLINRKFQIAQAQQQPTTQILQTIKQDDDLILSSSGHKSTSQTVQQAGNFMKMSTYPVVVSELSMQPQNTLSASAVATSNHNYSLQPTSQPITIINQQGQGNKIILNTQTTQGSLAGNSGNFTIATPIQDIHNKIHYTHIPTSNIKVNLVTSAGIQQGNIVVDSKNNEIVKAQPSPQQQQQQHHQQQQLSQQQQTLSSPHQRIKLEKTLNMYIDSDQKRVLYTKLVNLASIQHKNNTGQTTQGVQVSPSTTQILNKSSVQRLANAQAIVTNMRPLSHVITPVSATVNNSMTTSGSDVSNHKQQNNTGDSTISGGVNLNTTNR